jgi:hypothetical protein
MTVRKELTIIAIVLWWAFLLGFGGPFLVSAASTEAVLLGFALLLISGYLTYRYVRSHFHKEPRDNEEVDGAAHAVLPGPDDNRVPPEGPGR